MLNKNVWEICQIKAIHCCLYILILSTHEIQTLQTFVVTWKTTLSILLGADKGPNDGFLLKKLENLISTCKSFPILTSIEKASLCKLICLLSKNPEQAKQDLCEALTDMSSKSSTLTVTADRRTLYF